MNIFSRILFKSSPRAAKPAPGGTVLFEFNPSIGSGGNFVLTDPTGTSRPFAGNARSGTPVAAVKAVKTLTGTGTNVANGDTVTIGGVVYTFQTTLTNVRGNVKIGASAAASLTNLFRAINASGGTPGTDYAAANVAHPHFVATNPTATTVVITAKTAGLAATSIVTAESSAQLSWANTTAGVNGTPASAGDMMFDGTNFYFANGTLTTASMTGWRKIAHSAL